MTALSKRGRVSNAETKSFSRGKLDDWVSQRKEGRCLDLSECRSGASGRSFGFEGERSVVVARIWDGARSKSKRDYRKGAPSKRQRRACCVIREGD